MVVVVVVAGVDNNAPLESSMWQLYLYASDATISSPVPTVI